MHSGKFGLPGLAMIMTLTMMLGLAPAAAGDFSLEGYFSGKTSAIGSFSATAPNARSLSTSRASGMARR